MFKFVVVILALVASIAMGATPTPSILAPVTSAPIISPNMLTLSVRRPESLILAIIQYTETASAYHVKQIIHYPMVSVTTVK